ncbi:MAG: hypothetical protein JKY61_07485 [Planctomycetes bacterium]|nr:hypothetical protein [Planctomycetota bacterium]
MGNDAFYEWTATADGDFLFDTSGTSFLGAVAVYSGVGCAATCVAGFSPAQTGTGAMLSGVTTGDTFLVQVGVYSGGGTHLYLTVSELSDACLSAADDVFEDNDGCSAPRAMVPGHYSDLVATAIDSDFYSVVVPINHRLDVVVSQTMGDVDFMVFDSTCALLSAPWADFSYTNDTGSNQTLIFEAFVDHYEGLELCANYSLDIAVTLDPCLAGFDDFMEDNDTCSTPLPLAPGTYVNLWTGVDDSDFFAVTIPRNSSYSFSIDRGYGAALMRAFHSECSPLLGGNGVSINGSNPSSTPLELVIEVYVRDHQSDPGCASYDLTVDSYFDSCLIFVDDSFEPNNSCQTSTRLVDGTYANLQVRYADADFYWFCVGAGATLNLDVLFTHAEGNVDLGL